MQQDDVGLPSDAWCSMILLTNTISAYSICCVFIQWEKLFVTIKPLNLTFLLSEHKYFTSLNYKWCSVVISYERFSLQYYNYLYCYYRSINDDYNYQSIYYRYLETKLIRGNLSEIFSNMKKTDVQYCKFIFDAFSNDFHVVLTLICHLYFSFGNLKFKILNLPLKNSYKLSYWPKRTSLGQKVLFLVIGIRDVYFKIFFWCNCWQYKRAYPYFFKPCIKFTYIISFLFIM